LKKWKAACDNEIRLELHAKSRESTGQIRGACLGAKAGCPVSKLYNTEITLDIHLDNAA